MYLRHCVPSLALTAFLLAAAPAWASAPARVAILPIVVHTHEAQEYLQAGLADMLASRLGRVPGVAVIRVPDPERATTDLAEAQAAARDVGARYVLFGSFTRFGEGASLDVRCAAVTDSAEESARSIFVQSGTLGEIIPRLDALADKIGRYVVTGGQSVADVAAPPPPPGDELETLRGRVEALEKRVFGAGGDPVDEVDLGDRGEATLLGSDPALHSDLR